jgi:Type IV secretion-system coupling protein DNA-binding domain
MDEFALLPRLSHMSDGINFGRELGLKFLVATQNVNQVLHGYSPEIAENILSGFGTLFAFRLVDDTSRRLVQQRFGTNLKQITTYPPVGRKGVRQIVVSGNVIEDWYISELEKGRCIVSLPEGRRSSSGSGNSEPQPEYQCTRGPSRGGASLASGCAVSAAW